MSEISDKLNESMTLHYQGTQLRREGRVQAGMSAFRKAATLRQQAHALDPEHRDEAWQEYIYGPPIQHRAERSRRTHREVHEQMMAFYRDQGVHA